MSYRYNCILPNEKDYYVGEHGEVRSKHPKIHYPKDVKYKNYSFNTKNEHFHIWFKNNDKIEKPIISRWYKREVLNNKG